MTERFLSFQRSLVYCIQAKAKYKTGGLFDLKKGTKNFYVAAAFLLAFVLWTVIVCLVDVQTIGPQGTKVGLATVNKWIHELTGVHLSLYMLTDWLSLIPVGLVLGFAMLGLAQWIKRKKLRAVDRSLFVLGGFYIVVMILYLFFELVVVNYRPVLIEGVLEVSYPSSTTMLVMCVMPTAMMQIHDRIRNGTVRRTLKLLMTVFLIFMVLGRLISGVHWVTDIIGGGLLSIGLVMGYLSFSKLPL